MGCESIIEEDDNVSSQPDTVHNYIGMTRTTLHNRMLTHLKNRDSRMTSSPLYRHDSTVHNNDIQVYRCTKIASESKLVRLNCNEAIRIERQNESYSMNERNEGGRGGLVRISATRVSSS